MNMEYQKPDWLIKAEEQITDFMNTDVAKYSEGKLNQIRTSWNHAKYKTGVCSTEKKKEWAKKGGHIQGKIMAEKKIGIFGYDKETKSKVARKGGLIGGAKTAITNVKRYGREIQAFDYKTGELIGTWPSKGSMIKELNLNKGAVNNVTAGRANQHKGYTFKFTK